MPAPAGNSGREPAAGAVFLLALRLPRDLTMPERHFVHELREGWDAFRSRAWLWGIVLQFAFVNAAGVRRRCAAE